ncbi:hypothetical protein Ndes2526B_g06061 [Nannochloris sp. 'desiccata']|nr:hypothetical protein NADE_005955 [Chlorella desiccata (nom. nud.)]
MPTVITPRSGLVGDPRLAKLKEASLTRRRALTSENSIPAFRDEDDAHADELSELKQGGELKNINPTATAAQSSSPLLATGEALRILKLESAAAEVEDDSKSTSCLNRLQAVRSLASSGTAAAGNAPMTVIAHLRRRLRSTTAQLAFHEANASSLNATATSRKPLDSNAPWLPSSTTSGSKHKAAQFQARNKKNYTVQQQQQFKENVKPPRPSPQASALQAKLLTELKDRLQLKAALLALRQAVQQRCLLEGLVERSASVGKQATKQKLFKSWKQASLPGKEMLSTAAYFNNTRQIFVAKEALQVWKAWSTAQQRRRQAAAIGAAAHRHRLLAASLAHWKFAANMKHLSMLRSALAEGWVDNWGRRKAFLSWRRTACRQQQQRDALLAAAGGFENLNDKMDIEIQKSEESHRLPCKSKHATLAEAAENQRADARLQLTGLKLCIAEAAKELILMRPGLRWTSFKDESSANYGSITSLRPLYDPAAYSSPIKRRRQQYGNKSGSDPAFAAAEEIAADLFNCNEELSHVENECHALREKLRKLEEDEAAVVDTEATKFLVAAQQAEHDVAVAMMAFNDAENEFREAQVVLEIVNEEIDVQKTLLSERLQEASSYRAAADAAAAALTSARDEFETSSTSVEVWTRKVTLAAAELSRAAPTAKSAAALKLKEARHRLEMEKLAATEARQEIPTLLKSSQKAAERAQESEIALIAAQHSAVAASAAEASASSELNTAQAAVTAAETALKEAQETESTARSAYNAIIEKSSVVRENARQVRLQLFTREREGALLQAQVTELDERHAQFVALSLEYQHKNDEMELLESPLQAVALLKEGLPLCSLSVDPSSSATIDRDNTSLPTAAAKADDATREKLCIDDSESNTWSVATTPSSSPIKDPGSLTEASRSFYRSRLLRRAMHALQNEAAQWKELKFISAYGYCVSILPAAFEAWKEATADAVVINNAKIEIVKGLSSLKAWRSYTAKTQLLRQLEGEFIETRERQKKAACFTMLRNNADTQQRHRCALETAVSSRRSSLFKAWRIWTTEQRQLSETLHVALERKRLRCLSSHMQEWRIASHNDALLRRVFTAASDRWRACLGAAGYEAEFSLLQQGFAAWQVAAHVQREERRDGVLALAAESTRERALLSSAFTALKREAEWANERGSYLPLAHALFLSWREATLTSRSHMASLAAQQHYEYSLKEKVLTVWSDNATATACRVSVFYLKWQVDHKRRSVLAAWRQIIAKKQKWESRRVEAEVLRSKHSSPLASGALDVGEVGFQQQPHHVHWVTPHNNSAGTFNTSAAGTTPSTGARSVTPLMCGSSDSWHAKAAEWRQRQELYSGGDRGAAASN